MNLTEENPAFKYHKNRFERIKQICLDFKIDSLIPQITSTEEIFQESSIINIALVGGFKSGKSSFLNSLIGRDILPVGVLPLTSIITYVQYGIEDRARVTFLDGHIKEIAFEDIHKFICEQENPENIKKAAKVNLELTSLSKYRGIQFVDTPGIGSIYKHNTLTSIEWLPKIGAALMTVNSNHPASEEDIKLLKELCSYTPEIIILLTKVDLITEKETEQIFLFIKNQLRNHLKKDFIVLPFSNRPGYENIRENVFNYIRKNIIDIYNDKSKEILNYKTNSISLKCKEYLNLALTVADTTAEIRKQLNLKIKREKEILPSIYNEIQSICKNIKSKSKEDFREMFISQYDLLINRILKDLNNDMRQWKGNLARTSETFRHWARQHLLKELQILSEEKGAILAENVLGETLKTLSRYVESFQNRIAKEVEETLNRKFSGAVFDARVEKPENPDIQIGNVFMTPVWEMLWFIIPMWLFRPVLNRHFKHVIKWEAEKNLYRLSSQWSELTNLSIDNILQQTFKFIQNEITTIENILENSPDMHKNIKKALSEIENIS